MNTFDSQLPFVYLKPGEIYFSENPAIVQTVLGSCVSVTMFNRKSGIGMICHCLLPQCKSQRPCGGDCSGGFKYLDCSMRRMIEKFDSYDIKRPDIKVKVFGGADRFTMEKSISVGGLNIETALKIIKTERLRLLASDLGGARGRKIFFNTHTGDVHLKRLHE